MKSEEFAAAVVDADVHRVFLGLGANIGDREQTILNAYRRIERLIGTIRRQSAFFYSQPWGFDSCNAFVNTVVMVETTLSPLQVLHRTQLIERQLGKRREHASAKGGAEVVYHDRPIDIDILLYDDLRLDTPKLKIPHPLMQERDFVMIPLREVLLTYEDPEP